MFNSSTLVRFGDRHGNARSAFRELNRTLRLADWSSFQDVVTAYPAARAIGADRIIFNVKGNQFRVVAAVDYARRAIFIKFVGTHAEYDRIDAATVNDY